MLIKSANYQQLSIGLFGLILAVFLTSCNRNKPQNQQSPSEQETQGNSELVAEKKSSQEVVAKISEIQKPPVWVKLLNRDKEVSAEEDMNLKIGETIRTSGEALAQINLTSGLAFRIGGDSLLTLQPENQLKFTKGEMITWVEPGKKVPVEIVTPNATAGIRGTTVFIKIPEDGTEETEFFAWEGTVAVSLPDQKEEIILETGEQVMIGKGEKDIEKIRQKVRRLSDQELRRRRRESRLLNNFKRPLPTIDKIEEAVENNRANSPSPAPSPSLRRRQQVTRRTPSSEEPFTPPSPEETPEPQSAVTQDSPTVSFPTPSPRPIPASPAPASPFEIPEKLPKRSRDREKENNVPINSIKCWLDQQEEQTPKNDSQGIENLVCPARSDTSSQSQKQTQQ